jgi:predicted ATP-grasp superfamily ATP-dependent carboligase
MTAGAVVVGAHANGLGVVRSLAALGLPVAAVSTRPFDLAHVSNAVSERVSLPGFHQRPDDLIELLEARASRWRGRALFPANDDALVALSRHHERLSASYRVTVDPWEALAPVVDKDGMHELAVGAGLDVPRCFGEASSCLSRKDELPYPVIVKPLRHERLIDRFGVKVFAAENAAELERGVRRLEEAESPGLVWEWIPGGDDDIFVHCLYVDARGEPSVGLTVQKIRQNPPGTGGARVARVVDDPPGLRDASVALLRRARVRGMAFVEFKRDVRNGAFRFVEVNCRAVQFNALPTRAGADLVRATWYDRVAGEPVRVADNGWRGYWIHLQADVLCSIGFARRERLSREALLAPYRAPHVFAIWSARDPRPFLLQAARLARQAVGLPFRAGGRAAVLHRLRGGRAS